MASARSPIRRMLSLCLTGLLACALHATDAAAQNAPSSVPPNAAPAATPLKTTTRLVQVNVVVRDKSGAPVGGLSKEDFTLLDQNQPQTIATFSQEGNSIRPSSQQPLPPGAFTNRLDAMGKVPDSVTVVLLDTLNTRIEDQAYARNQIIKFLKQLHPRDHVAIYALSTRITVVHEFTQDTALLLHALDQYLGQTSPQLTATGEAAPQIADGPVAVPSGPSTSLGGGSAPTSGNTPGTTGPTPGSAGAVSAEAGVLAQLMNQLAGNGAQRLKEFNTISRAKITAAALESIALHLTRIPGRKNLVWVSGSFPIAIGLQADSLNYQEREVRNFERELESATRALNQANIAIYPVDARGLISAGYDTETRDTEGRTVTSSTAQIDQNAFATMDTLADRTGGRVFRDTNDIAGAVGKALTDSELTYAISFYPTHGKWDGKFHDIKIRVNRPGVQLHYRKGYFAVADSPDNDAERKAALDSVIGSPVDITGLSILAEIMPPRDNASQVFGVAVVLDLHELMFTDSGDKKNGILDFVFLQQDAAGKDMQGDRRHAEFNMEPAKYQSVLQSGLLLTNHVTLGAEAVSLKIVVRDAKSGAIGSLTVPLAPFRSPASK